MVTADQELSFSLQTGKLWAQFKNYETAEACYSKAMEYSHFLLDICNTADQHQRFKEECAAELFGLLLDRTAVAWQLQQKVTHRLAMQLLQAAARLPLLRLQLLYVGLWQRQQP